MTTTTKNSCGYRPLDLFECVHCGRSVALHSPDRRFRDHCPNCLSSKHMSTNTRTAREADCQGRMRPIGIAVARDDEWRIIHRCVVCDSLSINPVAEDDNQLLLIRLATRPLAKTPFPLEHLANL